jgi:hypothetical protein
MLVNADSSNECIRRCLGSSCSRGGEVGNRKQGFRVAFDETEIAIDGGIRTGINF